MTETQINNSIGVQPAKGMNLLQRVAGVIFSPGNTMQELIRKPRVIFPLILTAVSMLAFHLARFSLYGDYLRQSLISTQGYMESLTGQAMTADKLEQSVSGTLRLEPLTTPVSALLMWFVITIVFFAVFKIFGAKGRFKQYLSITGYAYVISVLYLLIALAASFFTGSLHIDLPLTSLANLLPAGMSGGFIYGVAKGIDIFSIWYFCVIGIGLAAVSGFKKRNAYIVVAVIFVAGLIISGSGELARRLVTGG